MKTLARPLLNFMLVLLSSTLHIAAAPTPVPAGIVTWWPGDNTIADIIGSNHGSLVNSATFGAGKVGRAFQLNGTDQSIQSAAATDVMKQLPLTIEGWVKPEARTTGSINDPLPTNVISNDLTLFGGHGFGVHLYPDGSKLNVGIEGATEDFRTVPGVTFTDGTWVHVAVVYTPGNVKTYLNGALQDNYSFTQGALNGDTTIRIGRHNDDAGYGSRRFFKGAIDELSLYHHALSLAEISAISAISAAGADGKARHDGARDYSTTTNPAGAWSYRWLPASVSLSAYNPLEADSRPLTTNTGVAGNGLHDGWQTEAYVSHNTSDNEIIIPSGGYAYTWLPRQLGMGPNSDGQRSVIRWTAPQSGRYAISGTFFGADTKPTTVDVHIFHNSTQLSPIDKRSVTSYRGNGVAHTAQVDVAANDTVDFIVGIGDYGWTYDSTGLAAFITRLGNLPSTSGNGIAAWGRGSEGALGTGATASENAPVPVVMTGALAGKRVVALASGGTHSLALDTDGKVYAWGINNNGQLGDGTRTQRLTPVAVDTAGALAGKTVTRIAACDASSFAITSDGMLYGWGEKYTASFSLVGTADFLTPALVAGSLTGKTVSAVACGSDHVLALTSDGGLHAWGKNHAGQLGNGTTTGRELPALVSVTGTALAGKTLSAIGVVGASSFALASDGHLFAWGINDFGQLGDGSTANRSLPVRVGGALLSKTVTAIASGPGFFQLALASDGSLFAWGDNRRGQLGDGGTTQSSSPVAVITSGALAGEDIERIHIGAEFSMVRTASGRLFTWGRDVDSELGDGFSAVTEQLEPVEVDRTMALGGQFVFDAAAGSNHALAITDGPAVQEIVVRDAANQPVLDAGSANLGNQAVGITSALKTFTIRNAGAGTLNVTSVSISGGQAAEFLLNTAGATGAISPGGSRTFTVAFTPSVLGARSTTLTIVSDDADEASFDFTLTGTGATDVTPPTLSITNAWIEKIGTPYAFKLLLDPRDDVGIQKIQVRSKINTTTPLVDTTPWIDTAWVRGQPLDLRFVCTSIVIEVRAVDAAGNASPLQRRVFKTPFPLSTAPNLTPKFVSDMVFTGAGPLLDCRGLFSADFDGDGRDDVLQIDRATGVIKVRKQQGTGSFVSNGFSVTANAVTDSAIGDFDDDGLPDIALVLNGALVVYRNNGPDGLGTLQFTVMGVPGLATTGISTVVGVAAGDVTGEGKDEIIITGTGDDGAMGTVTKLGNILHNGQFQLGASNNAIGFPTTSAGAVKLGDFTGDGWTDVVMIDAANNQVLLFINKGNGSFGGADDADTAARPQATATGGSIGGAPAQALAVGDVTGDGRADAVITLHGFDDLDVTGEFRDHLFWQLLDSRGKAPLNASTTFRLANGDIAATPTAFRSDVILQDLNGDRFPEAIFTNPFEAGTPKGGVRGLRITCQLDNTNTLTSLTSTPFAYATGASNPHRLAAGRFASTRPDIIVASAHSEQVQWIFSSFTESSKTYDLITGAATDSDPNGKLETNGVYTYSVEIGGLISYSINYVNNGTTAITGGVVDCLLASNLSVESGDGGYTLVPAGASKYIRWTQDIPAGSSGVKRFTVRVLAGAASSALAPNVALRKGTTVLVTKAMPKVVLQEAVRIELFTRSDSDPLGLRAHLDEIITYRLRITNDSSGAFTGLKLGMSMPANTKFNGRSPDDVLGAPTFVPSSSNPTSITWTNITLQPGERREVFVNVKVSSTVPVGTIIKNTTATVTRGDGQKVIAPAASTKIEPPLEITLKSNKSIVQPGDIIRYTFTARNWLALPVTSAKVVDKLPTGTALLTAASHDNRDAPDGKGNFIYSAGSWTAAQLSTTSLPAFDRSTGILTWALGTVPAGAQRDIEFEVIVAQDIPTFANIGGLNTTLEVQNKSFNFVASSPSAARIFAGTAIGGSAASALTATSDKLLSNSLTARRSLLSDPPLTPPKLMMFKTALGDGQTYIAGESFTTVINDSTVTTDGLCDYRLSYANLGIGTARNVLIKDYVPTNMTFVGHIWKNGAPIPSLVGCHFYDALGKEMPVIGAEGFTDTNGNGFYDVGEVYTDANGNRKYDGVTASLVRSMEFPAGDVGLGAAGSFVYRTKTISNPGIIIVSSAGGLTGVKNGLEYTKVAGYHLTADNLHFPVNGSPKQVKVLVTGPAAFDFPFEVSKSRSEMVGTEVTQIAIPFALLGGSSLTMSGTKITVTIPKGYLVPTAEVQDLATPTPNSRAATISRNASTGITTVTFPIDAWKEGNAIYQVQLDPATKSVLKGTNGQMKAPLRIEPTISGGYRKPGSPSTIVPLTSITRLLDALPVRDTVTPPPQALPVPGMAPPPTLYADAKIFVGRCAPVSVKRGDTFDVTIFVGNLTGLKLGLASIEMKIPAGCDYVSATPYSYNTIGTDGDEIGRSFLFGPGKVGSKVTWDIGELLVYEGGAVTLTLKVRDDFSGTRIDDNSCIFDVVNACGKTPGPLGIVVRAGNETTQSSEIVNSAASGLGLSSTDGVRNALAQTFTLGAGSCTITTGGADLVQLLNGIVVIQLGGGRVLTAGPRDKIVASGIRLVKDDPMMSVAVGPGDSNGVQLTKLPTLPANFIQPTNTMLANLQNPSASLVAAGAGNLVAAGGGNMVAAGAGNLVAAGAGNLVGPNGGTIGIASLVAAGGGNMVAAGAGNMVAAGAGNMVAAGAGNMVAAGAGNAIAANGKNPLVAAGAGNMVAAGAGNMVAAGGGNLVAAGAGNLVAAGAGNVIPNPR